LLRRFALRNRRNDESMPIDGPHDVNCARSAGWVSGTTALNRRSDVLCVPSSKLRDLSLRQVKVITV
jgi:hypothetical protein